MSEKRAPWLANCWYVAAWADELEPGKLLGRTLLDQPVVLFRDSEGIPHAIGGRCPHRFAALADGTLDETGAVACPYHGLKFGSDGHCVFNPHEPGFTPKVSVPAWPVIEKHQFIWIWMGDAERADPASIPDFAFLDDPHWVTVKGTIEADANYELYADNILDLSHAQFIHPALAAPAFIHGKRSARQEGDQVWYHVERANDTLSIVLGATFGVAPGKPMDFWTDVRWDAPAAMYLIAQCAEPGAGRETAKSTPSMHFLTPQSANVTHYFWAVSRETMRDDDFTQQLREGFLYAFEHEDKPAIRRQAEMMGGKDFWALNPLILKGDSAAIMARRTLDRMIRDEMAEGGDG